MPLNRLSISSLQLFPLLGGRLLLAPSYLTISKFRFFRYFPKHLAKNCGIQNIRWNYLKLYFCLHHSRPLFLHGINFCQLVLMKALIDEKNLSENHVFRPKDFLIKLCLMSFQGLNFLQSLL